ncbi:hypothetical protein QZM99_14560 [Burkholderia gladioli]|uniref:hypothetical protein n=1 Tax=Burkholderia gladioli TaxID=28095 RepID=UPI00264ABC91|nr:hypothetical protein [Burkholderia gladioli]MDN7919308.1 hypothetical protein [Burkholderia gladioli]
MPLVSTVTYDALTYQTESVIREYMQRAKAASCISRQQICEDIALGAFVLWSHVACEAALASSCLTALRDYEADMIRLEALTRASRRFPMTASPSKQS